MNNRNDYSRSIVMSLNRYYESVGMYPECEDSTKFNCINKDKCFEGNSEIYARGMQCHVGYNYGDTIKIVVSALDCGGGGSSTIEKRTSNVIDDHDNRHMRGTLKAVFQILGIIPDDAVYYISMINACKCSRCCSTNRMDLKYYENCYLYKLEELRILSPDIILFQGKDSFSLIGCKDYLHEIEDLELSPELKKYLKKYTDGDLDCYAVICIHPSARGRHQEKVNHFYNNVFPLIADYLKKKLLTSPSREK